MLADLRTNSRSWRPPTNLPSRHENRISYIVCPAILPAPARLQRHGQNLWPSPCRHNCAGGVTTSSCPRKPLANTAAESSPLDLLRLSSLLFFSIQGVTTPALHRARPWWACDAHRGCLPRPRPFHLRHQTDRGTMVETSWVRTSTGNSVGAEDVQHRRQTSGTST